jgi:hypothetical protein
MSPQEMLDDLNKRLTDLTETAGNDLTFGDPDLAGDFGDPVFFFWGQANDETAEALNTILGVAPESMPTDSDTLSVWRKDDMVVVLEPEGA